MLPSPRAAQVTHLEATLLQTPAGCLCARPRRPRGPAGGLHARADRDGCSRCCPDCPQRQGPGTGRTPPAPSPEHFADCLKHHFAAESGFGGLAEQSPVCGEAAVVPQHGGAAQRHRKRAGGHSARSRPPCLTGSQLTRPMRTREGGSGRTQSCSFSRPRGPSPAQQGRVSAAFKLAPLGGQGEGPSGSPGWLSGADSRPQPDPSLAETRHREVPPGWAVDTTRAAATCWRGPDGTGCPGQRLQDGQSHLSPWPATRLGARRNGKGSSEDKRPTRTLSASDRAAAMCTCAP